MKAEIKVKLNNTLKVKAEVKTNTTVINGVGELYKGDYVVIPSVVEKTLETKDKYLINDVTVTTIPFSKVSNNSGGCTVTIGVTPVDHNGETILLNL